MPPINTPSDAKYQDHGSTGHNTRFREPREFSDLLMSLPESWDPSCGPASR